MSNSGRYVRLTGMSCAIDCVTTQSKRLVSMRAGGGGGGGGGFSLAMNKCLSGRTSASQPVSMEVVWAITDQNAHIEAY